MDGENREIPIFDVIRMDFQVFFAFSLENNAQDLIRVEFSDVVKSMGVLNGLNILRNSLLTGRSFMWKLLRIFSCLLMIIP